MLWGKKRPEPYQARLLQELRDQGVVTSRLDEALKRHPRHRFFSRILIARDGREQVVEVPSPPPADILDRIYRNEAVLTREPDPGSGDPSAGLSSSSQPSLVCLMIRRLDLQSGHEVLEVGAGTGWNAALMAHLVEPGGSVVTIENQPEVAAEARLHLERQKVKNVQVVTGDGLKGFEAQAPYDRIMVTAGSFEVTRNWVHQLRQKGQLLVPFELGGGLQLLLHLHKDGREIWGRFVTAVSFMRLQLGGQEADRLADQETEEGAMRSCPRTGERKIAAPTQPPARLSLDRERGVWDAAGWLLYLFLHAGSSRVLLTGGRPGPFGLMGDDGSLAVLPMPPTAAYIYQPEGQPDGTAGQRCHGVQLLKQADEAWERLGGPGLGAFRVTLLSRDQLSPAGDDVEGEHVADTGPWFLSRDAHSLRVELEG